MTMIRKRQVSIFLWFVGILLASWLWVAPVAGEQPRLTLPGPALALPQTANPPSQPVLIKHELEESLPAFDGPTFGEPMIVPPGSDDYWVISSRRCRQKGKGRPVGCFFDVYHGSPDGTLRCASPAEWLGSLQPGVPVCIVTHGSFVDWETNCIYAKRTNEWIRAAAPGRPLHVIFYTWPSEGFITLVPQIDIGILGKRSSFNGLYLADLISQVPPENPICLIGHSHGARTTVSALHLLAGGQVRGYSFPRPPPHGRRIRTVLAASAIDHHWLNPGERYGCALQATESLLQLNNGSDLLLAFYPLRKPFSHRALSTGGFSRKDRYRLGWLNAKVAEIDVRPIIGKRHAWPYYYKRPELAAVLAPWVYFDEFGPIEIGRAEPEQPRRPVDQQSLVVLPKEIRDPQLVRQ